MRFLLALAIGPALLYAEDAAFATIDTSLRDLARITGWKTTKKIERDVIDRTRLKAFLEERLKEEIDPDDIRAEEIALKKFGLVPADFDLKKTTVDLMTEQAAAFYDYRKKKLFLLAGTGGMEQQTVLVHELAHALADQHYNLGKFLKKGKSDDSSLARMAVMEGQATWLMYELLAEKVGQSLKTSPGMVDMMSSASDGLSAQYPVLSKAPLYMRASLLFPYTQGLKFQQAVILAKGNAAFDEVYKRPPTSTQQILHPEKYLSGESAKETELPSFETAGYRGLTGGSVGEFDHAILLEQYAGKDLAADLAPHWKGGAYAVYEHKKDAHTILLYASEWDTAENARKMFDAYRKILQGKWKQLTVTEEGDGFVKGIGDDGRFELRRNGVRLTSVEGMRAEGRS